MIELYVPPLMYGHSRPRPSLDRPPRWPSGAPRQRRSQPPRPRPCRGRARPAARLSVRNTEEGRRLVRPPRGPLNRSEMPPSWPPPPLPAPPPTPAGARPVDGWPFAAPYPPSTPHPAARATASGTWWRRPPPPTERVTAAAAPRVRSSSSAMWGSHKQSSAGSHALP